MSGTISVIVPPYASATPQGSLASLEEETPPNQHIAHIPIIMPEYPPAQEEDPNMERARRSPSLAPTDIHNPEPETVERDLKKRGIKIRDFAHEPALKPPITESFNAQKALAEFDFRISQVPRTYPLGGRTLRRLIDIGFITEEEVKKKCTEVEIKDLEWYDSREPYPYFVFCGKRMTDEERKMNLESWSRGLMTLDRQWDNFEIARKYDEEAREEAERAFERMKEMLRESERRKLELSPRSMKRALEEVDEEEEDAEEGGSKRRRVTPEYDNTPSPPQSQSQSQSQSQRTPKGKSVHPSMRQQYPAPLSQYDPKIYPDAASIIGSRPEPEIREPTPPLPEENSQGGRPLRRGLKRTLSRTQTFRQL